MAEFLTYEEMGKKVAEEALDGYAYKGKTLREWIDILSNSENVNKWIPLKTRPMTDEERECHRDWAEYEAKMFDCPLPDDGQEVLISYGGYVCTDIFVRDDNDGCYFEGENIDDVEAWMPLPEPYEPQEAETWHGYHGRITAPKGTFKKIWEEAGSGD